MRDFYKQVRVKTYKIGGMGNSPTCKAIQKEVKELEEARREGNLTPKQSKDFQRDIFFRRAIREQHSKFILDKENEGADFYLLDRTPLMSWAYAHSVDSNNPHLPEILSEALDLTAQLDLDQLFHFVIDPKTVYKRIVLRSCKSKEHLTELVDLIPAPREICQQVLTQARIDYDSIAYDKKPFRIWDFMPYEEVAAQAKSYRLAMEHARSLQIRVKVIDASKSLDKVVEQVMKK
jgi:hypothetical protein